MARQCSMDGVIEQYGEDDGMMGGVEPQLMGRSQMGWNPHRKLMRAIQSRRIGLRGDAGDYYNIGAIEQFSGVEPQLMGDADFGAIEQFSGEDDGMMGGALDMLTKPFLGPVNALHVIAFAAGYMLGKKMK